jgi:maleylacetoacetate isomerase
MVMKLYGYFRSSAAFRVRIALNLKKLEYENAPIHLRRNDQTTADYLAVNPQGLVPTLKDRGLTLIQSLAIIEYLDETYPEPPLLPRPAADRARVCGLAEIVACDIHPINNLRVLRYLTHSLGHDEAAIAAWYNHWIDARLSGARKTSRRGPTDRWVLSWGGAQSCRHCPRPPGRLCRALPARSDPLPDDHPDFRELHEARALCRSAPGQSARSRGVNPARCR